jgi:hypothetical protein
MAYQSVRQRAHQIAEQNDELILLMKKHLRCTNGASTIKISQPGGRARVKKKAILKIEMEDMEASPTDAPYVGNQEYIIQVLVEPIPAQANPRVTHNEVPIGSNSVGSGQQLPRLTPQQQQCLKNHQQSAQDQAHRHDWEGHESPDHACRWEGLHTKTQH